MRIHWRFGVAAALVLLPMTLAAQQPQGRGRGRPQGGRMMRTDAIGRILEAKADLALTQDQTAKLTALRAKLEKENAPLLKKVEAARAQIQASRTPGTPPTDTQRAEMRKVMEQVRPEMQKLRENDRAAMDSALKLLNADQQKWVHAHFQGPRRGN